MITSSVLWLTFEFVKTLHIYDGIILIFWNLWHTRRIIYFLFLCPVIIDIH